MKFEKSHVQKGTLRYVNQIESGHEQIQQGTSLMRIGNEVSEPEGKNSWNSPGDEEK